MIRMIRESSREREEGFTLIELLVVVIIIGILAAVAIPVFLSQREKAYDSAAQSDVKNMSTAQESFFTGGNVYTDDVAELEGEGFSATDSVTHAACHDAGNGYVVSAKHTSSDNYWSFDSADGQLVSDTSAPAGGTCDLASGDYS